MKDDPRKGRPPKHYPRKGNPRIDDPGKGKTPELHPRKGRPPKVITHEKTSETETTQRKAFTDYVPNMTSYIWACTQSGCTF